MKRAVLILIILVIGAMVQAQTKIPAEAPVNPHASPEARALLKYLYSISGKYTLTGQHNYPNMIARYTDRAYDLTGKYPALYGQDFGFSGGEDKDSVEARPALIEEIERQYQNGAVIALTWHSVRPTSDEPVTFRDNVQSHLTDFEWSELLTPGTDLNKRWCAQVDVIAGYLKQLRDAHVPVLFRPYHEMNGTWFWWGGRPGKNGSSALYRQLYDRFLNVHHLDNLVWVWNVNIPGGNATPVADYFPGLEYADVLTIDNYQEFKQEYYDQMLALAGTKPIALGEVGGLPTLEVFKAQPRWTYFMIWSDFVDFATPLDQLRAVFSAPTMLVRDSPQLGQPMAAIRRASGEANPELVTPKAAKEAKTLLARLYSVSGKSVLSGQLIPASVAGGSDSQVFEITTKYPAVYGRELAATEAAQKAIVEEAKAQSRNQAIVSFTWRPVAPTQEEATGSASTQLTDYEWNQLLTPGTGLYQRWAAQVDTASAALKQLQDADVAVLWQPYPELNGKKFWWAGRKGPRGSAALYRQLFDRMVNDDGVKNLVWVWNAATPGSGQEAAGQYEDYFPGLLYADALALNADDLDHAWRADSTLSLLATGKIIGVGLNTVPDPSLFAHQSKWTWFLLSSEGTVPMQTASEALRKLYADPRVLSRSAEAKASGSSK